jgi:hypothetical protein
LLRRPRGPSVEALPVRRTLDFAKAGKRADVKESLGKLDKQVIVLNKSWQPITVITVQKALSMMAADAATAMDLSGQGYFVPVRWKDWLELSVTDQDDGIRTPSRVVRAPRVIIACPLENEILEL